jgi:membrane-bound lytic murein transglycosylase D
MAVNRTPHRLLTLSLLLLAACAHAPQRPATPPPAAPQVLNTTLGTFPLNPTVTPAAAVDERGVSAAAPAVGPSTTQSDASTPPPSAANPSPSGPTQLAGLTPAQYGDLFDRMRAGFRLPDESEHHAVEDQLRWYANNPEYLQRAFNRADLYLYYIVAELERRNMPLEIALLPVVESAFEPYAYSRARASGLWQFIPGTGSLYGLRQDWWYDGRRDIVESTRAALDYLQSLHDEFGGDWLLAIAAYNCGEALVERAVAMNRAAGRTVDFWSLWLPKETRAYVPKLLAMKRLVLDPEVYGLEFSPIPNQPYFARVAIKSQVSMKLAAEIAGITPDELYELNPAYHRWATDPVGPQYLLLPVDSADVFAQNMELLTPDQRLGVTRYSVVRGDSIASVAKNFNTSVQVLRDLNDMPTRGLTVGDELRVPSAVPDLPPKVMLAAMRVDDKGHGRARVQVVRHGDSLWTIARRHGMNVNTLALLNGMHPDDALRAGQRIRLSEGGGAPRHVAHRKVEYTVREGDTMAQIANLFQCSVPQLLAWNGLSSHSHIRAGQKLHIHLATRHG